MRELTPEEIHRLRGPNDEGIEYGSGDCTECGESLDSVELESLQRMCFACAMLRDE